MDIEASRRALSGKAQTVLGPVEPADLGTTITHEHLLVTLAHVSKEPDDPGRRAAFHAPVSLETLGALRFGSQPSKDNLGLADELATIEEVQLYKQAGGCSLVDATSIGLGRNPAAIARISRATGLNIIMGSSYYVEENYPPECHVDTKTEDEIVDEIVRDIFAGVEETGVRAGLVGEVGCSTPLSDNERKVLRASGRAQLLTGAPLMIHPGRHLSAPFEIVDVLREVDTDLSRTIMCHIERTIDQKTALKELAETECILEYDLFGIEHSYFPWTLPVDMPNDAGRLRWLEWLIAEGHGDQIVISHDIAMKYLLVRYGGAGYAHILDNVVPLMERMGFTEEDTQTILVDTPARLFAFQ